MSAKIKSAPSHRRLEIAAIGGPENLKLVEPSESVPPILPSQNHVVVKVLTTTTTYTDILVMAGNYMPKFEFPLSPGYDVIGILVAVGKNAMSTLKVGDTVACLCQYGGAQEYLLALSNQVNVLKTNDVDAVKGVTLVLTGVTAYQLLHRAGYRDFKQGSEGDLQGKKILVHSCTGGTGAMIVKLARLAGVAVNDIYGTCSSKNIAFVTEVGVGHPIDYATGDWSTGVPNGTIDIVLDPIGGDYFDKALRLLAPNGRYVAYGFTNSSQPGGLSIPTVLWQFFKMFWQQNWWSWFDGKTSSFYNIAEQKVSSPETYATDLNQLMTYVAGGRLEVPVENVVGLSGAIDALTAIAQMRHRGKTVVVVDKELEQLERNAGRIV